MDKSSPVYENFAKKMETMSGGPKINRSTMKIGGVNLEKRVSNNERKITLLKNIFKAQRIEIGEKLTPQVSFIEKQQESLTESNKALESIQLQLKKDYDDRILEEKKNTKIEREKLLDKKRKDKETALETRKKFTKLLGKTTKTIAEPFKNIFGKLFDFLTLILTGTLINSALKWYEDDKNKDKLTGFFEFLAKNANTILLVAGAIVAIDIASKLLAVVGAAKLLGTVLFNPATIAILGIIAAFYGLAKLGKELNNVRTQTQKIVRDKLYFEELEKFEKAKGSPATFEERKKILANAENLALKNRLYNTPSLSIEGENRLPTDDLGGALFPGVGSGSNYLKGLKSGGFTGFGNDNDVKGFVHANEFVLNKTGLNKIGLAKALALNSGLNLGSNVNVTNIELPPEFISSPTSTTEISATNATPVASFDIKNKYNKEFIEDVNLQSLLA